MQPDHTIRSWDLSGNIRVDSTIFEVNNILDDPGGLLVRFSGNENSSRRLVVVDKNVMNIYRESIFNYFNRFCSEFECIELDADEENKNIESVLSVISAMSKFGLLRRCEPIIVIGGGVIMDVVGLASSLYRRGIPYVRVPTSLMGQIDAGIGVKTGVNHVGAKNRIGTYYSPAATFIDRSFLRTLDDRHISNGIAEIIKIALVKSPPLFSALRSTVEKLVSDRFYEEKVYDEIYHLAIEGMLEELRPNLTETILERCVDYGHTFGPALEMAAQPQLLHGETVAIDMAISLSLSRGRNLMDSDQFRQALDLILAYKLPANHPLCDADFLWSALQDTTKHRNGSQRVPLTKGIGETVFVNDITRSELAGATSRLNATLRDLHLAN